MRVILKPLGLVVLLVGISSLAAVSFIATRRGGAATGAAPAPNVTRLVIGGLKEAEVDDMLGGDFVNFPGTFKHRAEGLSGGKAEGTLSGTLSFNCWDAATVAEAKIVDDPEQVGAKMLDIRNLSGRPSCQLYTWQNLPVQATTKYILSCEYKTEGDGVINMNSTGFAPRKLSLAPTAGAWKKVQMSVDREKAGDIGVSLQYFGDGAEMPLHVRSLHLWRVK